MLSFCLAFLALALWLFCWRRWDTRPSLAALEPQQLEEGRSPLCPEAEEQLQSHWSRAQEATGLPGWSEGSFLFRELLGPFEVQAEAEALSSHEVEFCVRLESFEGPPFECLLDPLDGSPTLELFLPHDIGEYFAWGRLWLEQPKGAKQPFDGSGWLRGSTWLQHPQLRQLLLCHREVESVWAAPVAQLAPLHQLLEAALELSMELRRQALERAKDSLLGQLDAAASSWDQARILVTLGARFGELEHPHLDRWLAQAQERWGVEFRRGTQWFADPQAGKAAPAHCQRKREEWLAWAWLSLVQWQLQGPRAADDPRWAFEACREAWERLSPIFVLPVFRELCDAASESSLGALLRRTDAALLEKQRLHPLLAQLWETWHLRTAAGPAFFDLLEARGPGRPRCDPRPPRAGGRGPALDPPRTERTDRPDRASSRWLEPGSRLSPRTSRLSIPTCLR